MDCRNCGAPMELFERRRYYYCQHCGTFEFIQGAAVDGIQTLERRDTPCPLCTAPLVRSLLDEVFAVDHCERCRGVLMPRATFGEAVTRRRAQASGPPAPPVPVDPRELDRHVTCSTCLERMDVHPYYGPGNIVIDTCSRCDLVWLDRGELEQITDAPGRDRGAPPKRTAQSRPGREPASTTSGRSTMSLVDVFDQLLS